MARADSWFVPIVARILALRTSEALTLGSRGSFEQYIRFAALFSLSVVLPATILVFLSLRSIRAEELQVDAELDRRAETLAIDVYTELQDSFERFEAATTDRMLRGQSPLANLAELSPYLRAAFRFDAEGRLVAPFELSEERPPRDPTTAWTRRWTAGSRAELTEDWDGALAAYRSAAASTSDPALAGEADFAAARVLWRAGRAPEAELALADLYADYGNLRDRWGFRIGDLAALLRAEIALERAPDVGRVALEGLVEQILSDRWTAGHPGEAAIARRALSLLEGRSDPDWLGRARIRLTERTTQLYWADQLLEQLEGLAAEAPRTPSGQFRYEVRSDMLWATLAWDDSLYAFSFDYAALVGELRASLLRSAGIDEEIFAQILPIADPTPGGTLRRQTLAPWAPSHTVVVGMADPGSILEKKLRMRRTRIVIIGLALAMSVLGVLLSLRLVRNELESARVKTDFAANVSHELRSPITQIRLKAEALQLDLVFDEDDRRAHHDAIVREAERLSRLVDNVLDFAAIEKGAKRYAARAEDLEAILGAAVEAARSDFESRDVVIELQVPDDLPVVWCDREAIAQVMTNLLSNASKYGSEGGWVGVRARPNGDLVEIAVSDRGIGIAPADLDHVFDHFFRSADPNVRRRKGTGIGLSIVRYIVEAHGGTITVDSTPGHGSTFTFTLPLQPPAGAAT